MGAIKHDWITLEKEYIEGNISQRELIAKQGVSKTSISRYAKDNEWVVKRKKYKSNVVAKSIRKKETIEANRLSKVYGIADNLTKIIDKTAEEAAQMNLVGLFSAADINSLTKATKELVGIIRNLYEIPTLGEREARELAIERLKIEKEKAQMGILDESNTGVVMLTPVLEIEDEDNE